MSRGDCSRPVGTAVQLGSVRIHPWLSRSGSHDSSPTHGSTRTSRWRRRPSDFSDTLDPAPTTALLGQSLKEPLTLNSKSNRHEPEALPSLSADLRPDTNPAP